MDNSVAGANHNIASFEYNFNFKTFLFILQLSEQEMRKMKSAKVVKIKIVCVHLLADVFIGACVDSGHRPRRTSQNSAQGFTTRAFVSIIRRNNICS